MENIEIFQRVFWTFQPSIEGFKHCRPVLSINGTHLYGKYIDTLTIAWVVMEIVNVWHVLELIGRAFVLYPIDI